MLKVAERKLVVLPTTKKIPSEIEKENPERYKNES